jgi:hypothetical protein
VLVWGIGYIGCSCVVALLLGRGLRHGQLGVSHQALLGSAGTFGIAGEAPVPNHPAGDAVAEACCIAARTEVSCTGR